MLKPLRIVPLVCLLLLVDCVSRKSSNFERELQAGIAASDAHPEKAVEHFNRAVQLNPESVKGHLLLGNAYRAAYNEGDFDDEDAARANDRLLTRALEEYKTVVAIDPSNSEALTNLGSNYLWLAKYDEAASYFRRALEVNPSEKQALYSLAVVDWERTYQFRQARRYDLHLRQNLPLIRSRSCSEVRAKNLEQVEEGITMLKRLSQLSDYDGVPLYLSVLYRERADIQCGDWAAYDADLRTVRELEQAACAARTRKAEPVPYPWPPPPPPPPHLTCWR